MKKVTDKQIEKANNLKRCELMIKIIKGNAKYSEKGA